MMKYVLAMFAVLLFSGSYAQNAKQYIKDSAWISRTTKDILELNTARGESGTPRKQQPFAGFIIKNATADTSYIGIKMKSLAMSSSKIFSKIVLKKGMSASLTNYLNNNGKYSFAAPGINLTCFIKRLRITEIDSLRKAANNKELYRRLTFEVEGYLNKENVFYPAVRLDTVAVSFSGDKNDFSVLVNVLNALAEKCTLLDTSRIFKRTPYSQIDLDKRYNRMLSKPVLHEPLVRGVYKTFGEFINNAPSINEYKFDIDRRVAILSARTATGEWTPEPDAFGFCDGSLVWININNRFRPLVRQGDTFEFLAEYRSVDVKRFRTLGNFVDAGSPIASAAATAIVIAASNASGDDPKYLTVYQLDMDNGGYY